MSKTAQSPVPKVQVVEGNGLGPVVDSKHSVAIWEYPETAKKVANNNNVIFFIIVGFGQGLIKKLYFKYAAEYDDSLQKEKMLRSTIRWIMRCSDIIHVDVTAF